MNREKHNLLAYITQVSFAMDDTVLFLDTHPCDKDALCYYNKLKKEREEAEEFEDFREIFICWV